jgi:protein-S-isoprenylcysteine O-methyltransferase Ste14
LTGGYDTVLLIFRLVVFIIVSLVIYRVSRASLRNYHTHGFYRFFAWETFLALMLLNLNIRAYQPTSLHHVMAVVCLILSGLMGVHGFQLLRTEGKLDDRRDDSTLLRIEKTTILVTAGAYKYVRHPLYCSFLLLTCGSYLFIPSWQAGLLATVVTLNIITAARMEEKENKRYFCGAYTEYMKRTKMFIPFVL